MHDLTAKRTLVKSPPELWSELSEVERLARHLGAFGEIRITRLEPERRVAWEGEGATGTVSIDPSGWGTKVTMTAQIEGAPPPPEPEPEPESAPEPPPEPEPEPAAEGVPEETSRIGTEPQEPPAATASRRKGRLLAWLFGWNERAPVEHPEDAPIWVTGAPAEEAEPANDVLVAEVAPEPAPEAPPPEVDTPDPTPDPSVEHAQAVLEEALEALGSAHHRPFSRS